MTRTDILIKVAGADHAISRNRGRITQDSLKATMALLQSHGLDWTSEVMDKVGCLRQAIVLARRLNRSIERAMS